MRYIYTLLAEKSTPSGETVRKLALSYNDAGFAFAQVFDTKKKVWL